MLCLSTLYNVPYDGNGYVLSNYLFEIGNHVQSKKKNLNNTIQHSEKEYMLRHTFLSVEVTMLPKQNKILSWNGSLFLFVIFVEVDVLQEPCPLLNLTDLKEVNDFSTGPQLCLFYQNKIRTRSRI